MLTLFFVFVGNAEPKTEMEDTNTDTNKSGSCATIDGSCITIDED